MPNLNQPVELSFIFSTIAIILLFTAIFILLVNKKAKKIDRED